MTTRIVLDLETYSSKPNAAIASIGAVKFQVSEKFEILDTFYVNIEQASNKEINRMYEKGVLDWWKNQNIEVKKSLLTDQKHIEESIITFKNWCESDAIYYSQGSAFDFPILQSSMDALNITYPWKYWNVRCCRTIFLETGFKVNRDKNHHNALSDAIAQAELLNNILFALQ